MVFFWSLFTKYQYRMAGTKELAALVARLEAVTSKLEGISAGGGGDDGACKLYYILKCVVKMASAIRQFSCFL